MKDASSYRRIQRLRHGYVFGFTSTTDDKPLFYQDKFSFQDDLPTIVSRYTLTLPDGGKRRA
jgi:hypothetical protein